MRKYWNTSMNLQLFAAGEPSAEGVGDQGQNEQETEQPTFDEMLKNRAYQAEFDRRLGKAIETARGKWQEETERRVGEARTEAEKLARMTEEQRAKHEREQREKNMADRERAVTLRELKAEAYSMLAERDLPKELAEVLNYTDADSCKASQDAVEKAFRTSVQSGVESRMRGTTPKTGGNNGNTQLAAMRAAMGLGNDTK